MQSEFRGGGQGKECAGFGGSSRAPLETRPWCVPDRQQRGWEKWMALRWILLRDRTWGVKQREDSNVRLHQLCGDWQHLLRRGSLGGGGSRDGEETSSPTSQHVALQPLLSPVRAEGARRRPLLLDVSKAETSFHVLLKTTPNRACVLVSLETHGTHLPSSEKVLPSI